ncbi:MAG: hypothetical protein GEU83_14285 [Pseudonocardiaceae bacterium]|nr:hypothetical protein [Pseudonocardiaceae bacterium]
MSASISEIGRGACKAGLIGVPLLLPVGLVLFVAWIVVSFMSDDTVDWLPVTWTWLTVFFLSAILGMLSGHWNRRTANWWHGRKRDAPRISFILTMSMAAPLSAFAVMAMRMRSDGVPTWLWVLGGLAVVLGVATFVDDFRSIGRGGQVPSKRSHPHG